MPASEFSQWFIYYQAEPFGAPRDNIHTGIIASTIANVMGGNKATANDFMLSRKTEPQQPDNADAIKVLMGSLRAMAKNKET